MAIDDEERKELEALRLLAQGRIESLAQPGMIVVFQGEEMFWQVSLHEFGKWMDRQGVRDVCLVVIGSGIDAVSCFHEAEMANLGWVRMERARETVLTVIEHFKPLAHRIATAIEEKIRKLRFPGEPEKERKKNDGCND
ncbi:MAG: hypothetical protein UY48_C0002G0027 [Candidatus Gottesmanbacteria bacterium GW2011_GWB1_49_7]|uniref:Uncharacterized protein n=1 Tax=Candidatus Gottesmanbacteria bacterium GW2011_GWB1_49_7 TaxID=1618448 RepID=A0A0G1W3J4_9BACT|nr:MAG: hypothetical protein UY48_C0002G0027 [Candidatus Gottesmanbacteria bacterium GW2011_GWB1_49_7]